MSQQATHSPAFVTKLSPNNWTEPEVKEKVEEKEYESLEEALLGAS